MPDSLEKRRQGSYWREQCKELGEEGEAALRGPLFRDRLNRENKLDTGEDRRDGASKSEQTARVSVRPSRAMQEWFRERSRIESVSVGRRLSQNS